MATETPSSTTNEATDSLSVLHDRLDALWIRHLQLLDDYTTAQAVIKKHLATGYLNLAQANFKSSGRRYGRDFYDDRAVAGARVVVEDERLSICKLEPQAAKMEDGTGDGDEKDDEKKNESPSSSITPELKTDATKDGPLQLPSPSPTPEPETTKALGTKPSSDQEDSEKPATTIRDPLRWFGILIPPTLRSAQKSFVSAVEDEDAVGKAVNAARGMREVDVEIRKLRKVIRRAEKGGGACLSSS